MHLSMWLTSSIENDKSHLALLQHLIFAYCCIYLSLLPVGIGCGAAHVLLHKGDVVVLFQVSVFLQVRSVVLWHCLDQIFDKFVGDE